MSNILSNTPVPAEGSVNQVEFVRQRPSLISRFAHNRSVVIGLTIVIALILTAIFAPLVSPYNPIKQSFRIQLQPPSADHLFGTDEFGRDIFSRVLYGTRWALFVGMLADSIALALGVVLGLMAGYYGGRLDATIGWLTDVMLAFPYLLLAMIVVAVLGPGITNAMIAIGVVYVPQYIRLVRGTVLSIREMEYVEAARCIGMRDSRVIFRHILPNCVAPIIVMATLVIGWAIVETAGLSFLGLGAQPPIPEWGAMLSSGRNYMLSAWWIATFPGLAILVVVIGFNVLGDGLRDELDPYLTKR
ncbi:MAG: ABC transporter permease [Chloroflexi bacterium]|nr:ABC transporter permease [Chloroflexota bacterium]